MKGFTFVEVMIVVAIIAILAMAIIPFVQENRCRDAIRKAEQAIEDCKDAIGVTGVDVSDISSCLNSAQQALDELGEKNGFRVPGSRAAMDILVNEFNEELAEFVRNLGDEAPEDLREARLRLPDPSPTDDSGFGVPSF